MSLDYLRNVSTMEENGDSDNDYVFALFCVNLDLLAQLNATQLVRTASGVGSVLTSSSIEVLVKFVCSLNCFGKFQEVIESDFDNGGWGEWR